MGAGSASDALLLVNDNESLRFTFEMCLCRTNLGTSRISAFVADDRHIIVANILNPCTVGILLPIAYYKLDDFSLISSDW